MCRFVCGVCVYIHTHATQFTNIVVLTVSTTMFVNWGFFGIICVTNLLMSLKQSVMHDDGSYTYLKQKQK